MPSEARRLHLSALQTKLVIRKTQEVFAASVRELSSGLSADRHAEALEVEMLFMEFMNLLLFRRPPGLERREMAGK